MGINIERLDFLLKDGQLDLLNAAVSKYLSVGLSHYTTAQQLEILYYALILNINEQHHINEELFSSYEHLVKSSTDLKHLNRFNNIRAAHALLKEQAQVAITLQTSLLQSLEVHTYPEVYASILDHAMNSCIQTKQYDQAIQLYAAAQKENLAIIYELDPHTYFHIHENLLDAYASLNQWYTAQTLTEALLNMPEIIKYPRYHQLLTIAYGYIISQKDIEKGVRICLPIIKEIYFSNMSNIDFKFAYEKWIDILERYGDEGLLWQYKKRAAKV